MTTTTHRHTTPKEETRETITSTAEYIRRNKRKRDQVKVTLWQDFWEAVVHKQKSRHGSTTSLLSAYEEAVKGKDPNRCESLLYLVIFNLEGHREQWLGAGRRFVATA